MNFNYIANSTDALIRVLCIIYYVYYCFVLSEYYLILFFISDVMPRLKSPNISSRPVENLNDDEILNLIDVQAFEKAKKDMLSFGLMCEESSFAYIPPATTGFKKKKTTPTQSASDSDEEDSDQDDFERGTEVTSVPSVEPTSNTESSDCMAAPEGTATPRMEPQLHNPAAVEENASELEVMMEHCRLSLEACDDEDEGKNLIHIQ